MSAANLPLNAYQILKQHFTGWGDTDFQLELES